MVPSERHLPPARGFVAATLVAAAAALAPAPAAAGGAGLSAGDTQALLERLAEEPAEGLDGLADAAGPGDAGVPAEAADRVRDPPPWRTTAHQLVDTHPEADREDLDRAEDAGLPGDVRWAASSMGQGVLAAHQLAAGGDARSGGLVLQQALEEVRPSLVRAHLLLEHREAYTRASWDEDGTRALAGDAARGEVDAAALAMVEPVPDERSGTLAEELALLYAQLGLPVDREHRVALALADGLDPQLRHPLADALAHLNEAISLREAAFSGLAPHQARALGQAQALETALATPSPTEGQLALLRSHGSAVEAVDQDALRRAMGHLAAAEAALADVQAPPGPAFPQATHPQPLRVGGLELPRVDPPRVGSTTLDLPEGSRLTVNATTGEVRAVTAHGIALATPALTDPRDDVVFQDPLGLVTVSGFGNGTHGGVPGPTLEVPLANGSAPGPPADGRQALDELDRALDGAPTYGAFAFVDENARRQLDAVEAAANRTPRSVNVTVNPSGYRALHVDLGGDDTYRANAGGAGEDGLLRVGVDRFRDAVDPQAAATPVPSALLVERAGDDTYRTDTPHAIAGANASLARLADLDGDDAYELDAEGGLAAARAAGLAVLDDATGDDAYEGADRSLAASSTAGAALLDDATGDDTYRAEGTGLAATRTGATAALVDADGSDRYASGNASQAFSNGGVALLVDATGDDAYDQRTPETSQGYAEPYRQLPGPCPVDRCPEALGPARLALMLDLAGSDEGACEGGRLENEAVGRVGVGRDPLGGPYNPRAGTCLDVDADAPSSPDPPTLVQAADEVQRVLDGDTDERSIPPTFFASSFGNATIPGVFRVGGLGGDLVDEPYLLNLDLTGQDTYRTGAVAVADAERAATGSLAQGYVAPASAYVDLGGDDTYEVHPDDTPEVGGAFAYADGGVALQASLFADDDRPRVVQELDWPSNTWRNVTRGLAAAEDGGLALMVHQGVRNVYEPVDEPDTACRLACANTGGTAAVLAEGGPGDRVNVTNSSLGAVVENPLGGTALYYHKGGSDTYRGWNDSMGAIRPQPWARDAAEDALEEADGEVDQRPSVALFVKDGWREDTYDIVLPDRRYTPDERGDDRRWLDADTAEALEAFGNRTVHVAQGIDNLDWFAQSRMATVDDGVGAGPPAHPAEPVSTLWGPPPVDDERARPAWDTLQREETGPGGATGAISRPGTTTGESGVQPVTLARTPLSPVLEVTELRPNGSRDDPETPHAVDTVQGKPTFTVQVDDPPAYTHQKYDPEDLFRPGDFGAQSNATDGATIQRVDLAVEGLDPSWEACPDERLRSDVNPERCVVVAWERGEDGELPRFAETSVGQSRITLDGTARQRGEASKEDLRELQETQQELHDIPVMSEYLQAENDLELRLQALNEYISDPLEVDFSEKAGGCCED